MKKFIILLTAGTAFALASCASSGGCCGKCKTSCDSKTECSAEKKSCCGSCGGS